MNTETKKLMSDCAEADMTANECAEECNKQYETNYSSEDCVNYWKTMNEVQ